MLYNKTNQINRIRYRIGSKLQFQRNFFHRINRQSFHIRRRFCNKADEFHDPFRAYRDPKYYTKFMNEPQKFWMRDVFETFLFLKKGTWNIFDYFWIVCGGTLLAFTTLDSTYLGDEFGFSPHNMRQGKWWTPFTSIICHENILHFGANWFYYDQLF
eukprot:UN01010